MKDRFLGLQANQSEDLLEGYFENDWKEQTHYEMNFQISNIEI
jgi:hypothetical protein